MMPPIGSAADTPPPTVSYEPFAEGVLADPYPWYRWLRAESPCHHVAERDVWVVSRYDDVVATLRNHSAFSSAEGVGFERRSHKNVISSDPPEHTRLRRLINREFLPRTLAALVPRIEEIVDELLDVVLQKGEADWVSEIAEPLPVLVIAEMLGLPAEGRAELKRWSNDVIAGVAGGLGDEELARVDASRLEFSAHLRELMAVRRRRPSGDMISALLTASDDDPLTETEIIAFCILLLVAGNETTTNAIGNGALAALSHPDQWRMVQDNGALLPSFIEESLRFEAPIQGLFRNTLAAMEVAGRVIPPGSKVLVLFGSANRDARHYPDGDSFVVTRNPMDHVAFGNGIHHCLGAPLARLELDALGRATLRRVKRILPAGTVRRTRTSLLRGVRELPVVVEAR